MTTKTGQPAYTPGPWEYSPTAGNHDFSVYAAETGRRDIALVRDFHEANARLIAAAPEMAETLQFIMDAYSRITLADFAVATIMDELDDIRKQAGDLLARIDGTDDNG